MWQHMLSMSVMRTMWTAVQITSSHSTHYKHTKHMLPHNDDGLIILFKFLNILIVFNISNINKEINKNSLKMILWEFETCWSAS